MLKVIDVPGADGGTVSVPMRADASVPVLYRVRFKRDIFQDMGRLSDKLQNAKTQGEQLEAIDLELFENIAYILAKHADKSVPDDPNEWLEQFSMFSITEILPEILELWGMNISTTSKPKKKSVR